ncbi:MAG: Rieske 2Fe-2S domain-containing protein [Acidobacteria bacterium]|nr:Rieske 2Fe-2S domain-containing protein [Acidobacteriota bacterium]MBI1982839.1 Rieske 2Fe-2S domain-containing protein [Acidobacteriota bacterium]
MADFVKVADLSELEKGACKAVEVSGKTVALFNVDGTVYALDNTCLHRGGPLGEGMLEGDVVTCPWHMWQYNVRSGEKVATPSVKVATYAVQVEGNDIKVAV